MKGILLFIQSRIYSRTRIRYKTAMKLTKTLILRRINPSSNISCSILILFSHFIMVNIFPLLEKEWGAHLLSYWFKKRSFKEALFHTIRGFWSSLFEFWYSTWLHSTFFPLSYYFLPILDTKKSIRIRRNKYYLFNLWNFTSFVKWFSFDASKGSESKKERYDLNQKELQVPILWIFLFDQ